VDGFAFAYEGFDPAGEGLREALTSTGNGFLCARGAAEWEDADGVHYPGTYAHGVYNRETTILGGRPVLNEDLVNLPNWTSSTPTFRAGTSRTASPTPRCSSPRPTSSGPRLRLRSSGRRRRGSGGGQGRRHGRDRHRAGPRRGPPVRRRSRHRGHHPRLGGPGRPFRQAVGHEEMMIPPGGAPLMPGFFRRVAGFHQLMPAETLTADTASSAPPTPSSAAG
jgi:hypothetical protein